MNYRDILIEDLLVGDTIIEIVNDKEIQCEIITLPVFNEGDQSWSWTSKNILTGNEVHYWVGNGMSNVTFATEDTI